MKRIFHKKQFLTVHWIEDCTICVSVTFWVQVFFQKKRYTCGCMLKSHRVKTLRMNLSHILDTRRTESNLLDKREIFFKIQSSLWYSYIIMSDANNFFFLKWPCRWPTMTQHVRWSTTMTLVYKLVARAGKNILCLMVCFLWKNQ